MYKYEEKHIFFGSITLGSSLFKDVWPRCWGWCWLL